jgi:hypothetical protein
VVTRVAFNSVLFQLKFALLFPGTFSLSQSIESNLQEIVVKWPLPFSVFIEDYCAEVSFTINDCTQYREMVRIFIIVYSVMNHFK